MVFSFFLVTVTVAGFTTTTLGFTTTGLMMGLTGMGAGGVGVGMADGRQAGRQAATELY